MAFRVDVVSMGRMEMPAPEVFWMRAWDEWFDANFWMVVARDESHTVVVNTGPPQELDPLNLLWRGFHPSGRVQFRRAEGDRPENALARLGIEPSEVTHVLFSPLVAYTVGGIELFPNARYLISRRGWIEDVFAPPYPPHVPREIFLPDDAMRHLLFSARDRVDLVTDGEVLPGLRIWDAGVHHRSSLAVEIETSRGLVIATDSAFTYRNVEENIYLGIGESYSEAMSTYARLRRDADLLIPLYDPEVESRHPGGHVA